MAKTEHYYIQFEPNCHYHVFNRAVDKKNLFFGTGNYAFFLKKYDEYLSGVVTTLSYALLGNHFHFGIRIKPLEDLMAFGNLSNLNPERYASAHALVSHQFQRLFQSYAMAFNKQQGRTGTLFQTPFKRCAVDPDDVPRMIIYHHLNPQHHSLIKDFRLWPWTSYPRYLAEHPSKLQRKEVFDLFGGREQFVHLHLSAQQDLRDERWVIEA